jgi:Flp pilus assembly pilin Flp
MALFLHRRAPFRRDERGAATVEFVIVALGLFAMLFTMFESGALMMRSVMLERGLDLGVRDIRLGRIAENDMASLKTAICDSTFLLGDCENALAVEVWGFEDVSDYLAGGGSLPAPQCRDRSLETPRATRFDAIGPSEIALVRACFSVDPFFPGLGLGASLVRTRDSLYGESDADPGYAIVKTAAFMREPL